LLKPWDVYCTECGTRYGDGTDSWKQSPGTADDMKTEPVCINTIKGKMAIIYNNLYFLGTDGRGNEEPGVTLLEISMGNIDKTRTVLTRKDFFRTVCPTGMN